jgi:hypothetical protein
MVCVNHVSPAERKLAIQPLLGRLEESLRLPEASEQQLAAFGLDVFRSVLQGRPEASVHDAIIRLSEGLDAELRKDLAERCIEVTLRCDADEDWWLLFRETNFPGGVCGDAQQEIAAGIDSSAAGLEAWLIADQTSPSHAAARNE